MSEWVSVLAVFWLLWAADGVRLGPRRVFSFVAGPWRRRTARSAYSRLSVPGVSPLGWRMTAADVPVALSPAGVSNEPAGAAGRPVETPPRVLAWRWEDVRETAVAQGSIFVNGERFCADTGHVSAPQLLALARLAPAARDKKIRALISRWFRIANLRRRQRVLLARTRTLAALNTIAWTVLAGLTVYVAGDVAARLPARWSATLADALPALLLGVLGLHLAATVMAFRVVRRLRPVTAEKRRANLLSALLLPPQALRLRALLGEGFFPPQHPLAVALSVGRPDARTEAAFHVLADLRWPLRGQASPALAHDIAAWFRAELEREIVPRLAAAGVAVDALLAPPEPDAPASCSYCPRCRDQFVAGPAACPHGVPLRPLGRSCGGRPEAGVSFQRLRR